MEIIERTQTEKERPGTEDRVPEQDPVKLYVPHRKKMHTVRDPQAPVGVFDSGVGGLTVAREIMRLLPEERIVYFGDTARLPYGAKTRETITRYSRQIVRFLRHKGVKAIVIACNTASSYALETLARESDIPMIGVIYAGAVTAVKATRNGRVGVIGTRGTVNSDIYGKVIKGLNPNIRVFGKACPLLVPLVEEGLLHDSVTDEIAARYLQELKGKYVDTLVLGCTHYPLLRSTVARIMGSEVTLVNPAYETALELKQILAMEGLLNPGTSGGEAETETGGAPASPHHEFYVSDLADNFRDFASSILPGQVDSTQKIEIEEY